ncbi:transcriptional repressor [Spirochaetia bacterium]|nr:transcriptional repressor [Spirochaetia bacterium]
MIYIDNSYHYYFKHRDGLMDSIGRKRSRQREAILELIRSTTAHPGAQWVYDRLKLRIPGLSLATVYRNIGLFREEGKVISVGVVNGEERFDGLVSPHPHLVCGCCGKMVDLPCPAEETLKLLTGDQRTGNRVTKGQATESHGDDASGFVIDYRKTLFYGLCPACAGQAAGTITVAKVK